FTEITLDFMFLHRLFIAGLSSLNPNGINEIYSRRSYISQKKQSPARDEIFPLLISLCLKLFPPQWKKTDSLSDYHFVGIAGKLKN
ncbi:MAG: hypothetical protein KAJ16_03270, partial [Calditrichia bacterium]|nr:hypothetical protein [Calditrichia bacterium]